MEDLLVDIHLAQSMAQEGTDTLPTDYKENLYFAAALAKHGVTKAQFDSSLTYYYIRADRFSEMYKHVAKRLSEQALAQGATEGEVNRFAAMKNSSDTADIWRGQLSVMLMPYPAYNRYDFEQKADTSFRNGDSFIFIVNSDFIYQSGSRDAVVCLLAKYEGDSITQTVNHITITGQSQVRIPQNRDGRLKELRGYIYLNNNEREADVRKMLFISQIQLIRFHQKKKDDEPKTNEASKADSLRRVADSARVARDTTRRGDQSGERRKLLPADKGTAIHRMGQLPAKPTRR